MLVCVSPEKKEKRLPNTNGHVSEAALQENKVNIKCFLVKIMHAA